MERIEFNVPCPLEARPGDMVTVSYDGREWRVRVPAHVRPGQRFIVSVDVPRRAAHVPTEPNSKPLSRPLPSASNEDDDLARALAASLAESEQQHQASSSVERHRPQDVQSPVPVMELFDEYERGRYAALYNAKLSSLSILYRAVRRIRGEGNCFYRSFWMGWVERMLENMQGGPSATAMSGHPLLADPKSAEWEECIVALSDRSAASFKAAGADALEEELVMTATPEFIEVTRGLCRGFAEEAERGLLTKARETEQTAKALRWLRLIASAHMRGKEDFSIIAIGMGYDSLPAFCSAQVEADCSLADEPQITALTEALGLAVRVEYLEEQPYPWSSRCGPHRHVIRPLEASKASGDGPPIAACVLFRPGHYDLLHPRDWSGPFLTEPDGERLVLPRPPPTPHPTKTCHWCHETQVEACWLCGEAVCTKRGCQLAAYALSTDLGTVPGMDGKPVGGVCCPQCFQRFPRFNMNRDAATHPPPPRSDTHALWSCDGCEQLNFPSGLRQHQLSSCVNLHRVPAAPTRTTPAPARAGANESGGSHADGGVDVQASGASHGAGAARAVSAAAAAVSCDDPPDASGRVSPRSRAAMAAEARRGHANAVDLEPRTSVVADAAAEKETPTANEVAAPVHLPQSISDGPANEYVADDVPQKAGGAASAEDTPDAALHGSQTEGDAAAVRDEWEMVPRTPSLTAPGGRPPPPASQGHSAPSHGNESHAGPSSAASEPMAVDDTELDNEADSAEVERLLRETSATSAAHAGELRQMTVSQLKQTAREMGITSPNGNPRHKKTWVEAIITSYEVRTVAAAIGVSPPARVREPEYAFDMQRLQEDIERLERAGYARQDCEQALRICENDYEGAARFLQGSRAYERQPSAMSAAVQGVAGAAQSVADAAQSVAATVAGAAQSVAATVEGAVSMVVDAVGDNQSIANDGAAVSAEERARQEQASADATYEIQQSDLLEALLDFIGNDRRPDLRPEDAHLAIEALRALHGRKVALTEAELYDRRFEAIGLAIEARFIPQEIECIAAGGPPEYGHACMYCRRRFQTLLGLHWHETEARDRFYMHGLETCIDWKVRGERWARAYDIRNGNDRRLY